MIDLKNPIFALIDIDESNINKEGISIGTFLFENTAIPHIYIPTFLPPVSIIEMARKTQPNDYLIKPIRPLDLKNTISYVLNFDCK